MGEFRGTSAHFQSTFRALFSSWQYSVNSFSSHTMNTLAEVFLCSEQFYMHKNTSASVIIVWELKELTEYCQPLKKSSESALEVRRCTTKFSHLAHMRRRKLTCSNASLLSSEQFYMHKNTSASVFIVWELKELTEYCQLLKRALKVLWKCADVPRNSPTLHTCAEGDHLFQFKFTSSEQFYIYIRTLPQVYSSCES